MLEEGQLRMRPFKLTILFLNISSEKSLFRRVKKRTYNQRRIFRISTREADADADQEADKAREADADGVADKVADKIN